SGDERHRLGHVHVPRGRGGRGGWRRRGDDVHQRDRHRCAPWSQWAGARRRAVRDPAGRDRGSRNITLIGRWSAMMRSLFAGVSGMRNHQVRMDVIGNNIANVNTLGFKASRVTFEEALSQLVRGASRPGATGSASVGGRNPMQVGLGVNLGSIDRLFTQGNLENTGVTTDLAIQGDSLFVLSDGSRYYYTRAGNFQIDGSGRLVSATNGLTVQGRIAVDGVLTDQIGDIVLPIGQSAPARATSTVRLAGNLDAQAADGTTRETTITVYDSLGTTHELRVVFTKNGPAWDLSVFADGGTTAIGTGTVTFTADGRLDSPQSQSVSF